MKKTVTLFLSAALCLMYAGMAFATPSTTFWTPATTDVQPYKVPHLGIDNYFTLGKKTNKGALPTDVGLTVGILPYQDLQMEAGVDVLEPSADPFFFNARIGTPEGTLFEGSPALSLGLFDFGTQTKVKDGNIRTDFNIVYALAGKTLPMGLGRIHAGGYTGNSRALINRHGNKDNTGVLIGWDRGFAAAKENGADYCKWVLAADYASGKNYIGGGGIGLYHYFTKDISLLAGPVWLNEPAVAGPNPGAKWVFTTQLDINF